MSLEKTPVIENEKKNTVTCFRVAREEELEVIKREGKITRASLNRTELPPPQIVQSKLESIIFNYFEKYAHGLIGVEPLLEINDSTEFLLKSIELITGLKAAETPIIKEIASGKADSQTMRTFFITFAPELFNIVLQTATSSTFSSYFSLTYGGMLFTTIPENNVLIELEIPRTALIIDPAFCNTLENEVLVDEIKAEWVKGEYRTSSEITSMLESRTDLPVHRFLEDVDMHNHVKVNNALNTFKRHPLNQLLDNDVQAKMS